MDARHTLCALALALPSGLALAQAAAPAHADAEPRVQHIVVEDEGSRIEELRVRGATQRITVQPKVGTDRKSTRLNSSHVRTSRMPSSA